MENSLLIAGFGGQGVILIGQLLGYAATSVGKNATFFPAYGAEQRGGTANCTVVISDQDIGSPVVSKLDVVIVMNEPSLMKFIDWVKPGGTVIINSSLINCEIKRDDVRIIKVPANEIAYKLGSLKSANMVLLGSYLKASEALSIDTVIEIMKKELARKPKFIPINEAAIHAGINSVS